MTSPWIYDERVGMVAVYEAPVRNCLGGGEFIFAVHFEHDENQQWVRNDAACVAARMIVDQHEHIANLERKFSECQHKCEDLKSENSRLKAFLIVEERG